MRGVLDDARDEAALVERTFAAFSADRPGIGRFYGQDSSSPSRGGYSMPMPVSKPLVAAPLAADPDVEVEEDLAAELHLELAAGAASDLLDLGAPLADQDSLLGLGLGPDLGVDLRDAVVAALDVGHLDLDRVGQLVACAAQHLLAHQLGEQDVARLVGALLGRVHELAFGDQLLQPLDQGIEAGAVAGADREDLVHAAELGGLGQHRRQLRVVEAVHLVDRAKHGGVEVRAEQRLGDEPVARADALLRVDDEEDDVGVGQLALDAALHPLGQDVARPLHPGQVGEDELPALRDVRGDAADRSPGGLRAVRDDRDAGSDDRVDERRLAGVRAPGEADEPRSCRGLAHLSDSRTFACRASISPSSPRGRSRRGEACRGRPPRSRRLPARGR